jgi:hypothetical protein
MTRGDLLTYYISYALIRARKVVRGLKQGLTEEDRQAVAKEAVTELKKYGDPWKLNEEAPDNTGRGGSTSTPLGPYGER